MNRRHIVLLLAGLPLAAQSITHSIAQAQTLSNLASSLKDPLIAMLTSKLGITDNQAQGGMGSLLTLAKEKLPAADFTKFTNLIPAAGKYMEIAKTPGAVVGPLKNVAGLNGALGKLGMSSDAVKNFIPTVSNMLSSTGGATATNLLAKVLK